MEALARLLEVRVISGRIPDALSSVTSRRDCEGKSHKGKAAVPGLGRLASAHATGTAVLNL